jgi:hypothetical protein
MNQVTFAGEDSIHRVCEIRLGSFMTHWKNMHRSTAGLNSDVKTRP